MHGAHSWAALGFVVALQHKSHLCSMTFLDQTTDLQVENQASPSAAPASRRGSATSPKAKRLSLALQGGGALGAFTWGVLDRLLEEDITFDAVSGSSAGAMNGVLLASGLAKGGPAEARASLDRFWHKVSDVGQPARRPWNSVTLHAITSKLSPYQFNPLDLNPLRDIIAGEVDVEAVRNGPVRLLLGTTHVNDGELRIFGSEELTLEVLLASACLPHASQAVSIGGEAYWDGGYAANPPLLPLVGTTPRTSSSSTSFRRTARKFLKRGPGSTSGSARCCSAARCTRISKPWRL